MLLSVQVPFGALNCRCNLCARLNVCVRMFAIRMLNNCHVQQSPTAHIISASVLYMIVCLISHPIVSACMPIQNWLGNVQMVSGAACAIGMPRARASTLHMTSHTWSSFVQSH